MYIIFFIKAKNKSFTETACNAKTQLRVGNKKKIVAENKPW